mmetsp:Transcript_9131/g.20132  ORF Transcript_9131/g.20132 Transcript_9131/m.20132 type:complete len:356 (+) Transcript_9131:323-1390(+)
MGSSPGPSEEDAAAGTTCRRACAAAWFSWAKDLARASAWRRRFTRSSISLLARWTARRRARFSPSRQAVSSRPSASSHSGRSIAAPGPETLSSSPASRPEDSMAFRRPCASCLEGAPPGADLIESAGVWVPLSPLTSGSRADQEASMSQVAGRLGSRRAKESQRLGSCRLALSAAAALVEPCKPLRSAEPNDSAVALRRGEDEAELPPPHAGAEGRGAELTAWGCSGRRLLAPCARRDWMSSGLWIKCDLLGKGGPAQSSELLGKRAAEALRAGDAPALTWPTSELPRLPAVFPLRAGADCSRSAERTDWSTSFSRRRLALSARSCRRKLGLSLDANDEVMRHRSDCPSAEGLQH